MLSKSILHNRIGKWTLAFTEFSLIFVLLEAIKGQVVTYLLADHLNIIILECYIGNKPWILYSNGLKHVNRGKKGCCFNFPK